LSFDKLPTMSDALFRRVHLFANGFLAHAGTRWQSLSKITAQAVGSSGPAAQLERATWRGATSL
jgi:hypothetical protein